MSSILLFAGYLLLFTWIIPKLGFNKKSGLSKNTLSALFLIKTITGCIYGYIHANHSDKLHDMDTWRFYFDSLDEMKILRKDPYRFFRELFIDPYHGGVDKIFSTKGSYWNDLKNNIMVKLVTIFDLFSLGNYYVNLIFFNFITFFGPVALYRTFIHRFPLRKKTILTGVFLLPSVLFWSSGLHKEGLLLLAIGLLSFNVDHVIQARWGVSSVSWIIACLCMIFILRNNVIFALLPSLIAWYWSEKNKPHAVRIFLIVDAVFVILFFISPYIIPKLDLPLSMHLRQQEFIALGGRMAMPVSVLQPDLYGFIHNLPSAFSIAFLHPLPGEGGLNYLPFSLELICIGILFILSLLMPARNKHLPILLFSANFALLLMVMIGYIVPNIGAVIRYKSIGFPFLFFFMALTWDRKKTLEIFNTIRI